ncbi:hypothetical protein H5P28_15320 [Ruficoccus amylovorans]|uniref:Uncharacterized protein n=1 Tax=Ruficoccus amylovorans TaxID=1804625 RepID=A0A842HJG8_9BACT|nr:hypothetical protein [Ruficoccus amylovorans]MBC2595637.1 hypothetical protein [Ruficoccus amylovorans]
MKYDGVFIDALKSTWLNARSEKDSIDHQAAFWSTLRCELGKGEFWHARLMAMRTDYDSRLAIALENLPLPAAFIQACVSLRQIIKKKRRNKVNYDQDLKALYHLAVIESFTIDYSERAEMPGFRIMEIVPGALLSELPYSYNEIGYKNLNLLLKTDIKWIVESWGEPLSHTSYHQVYIELWRLYEDFMNDMKKRRWDYLFSQCNS